jgi:putative CocE/NonD family hydrolase
MKQISSQKKPTMIRKWLKGLGLGLVITFCLVVIAIVAGSLLAPNYRTIRTPAGFPVNDSFYIPLEKGGQVWVSVWLPEDLGKNDHIPTLVQTSRYARQLETGWLYKATQTLLRKPDPNKASFQYLLDRGYACVWIQSPGSCQSTGIRYTEYPPEEIEAMRKVGGWIVDQPWSNGRFGAFGTSYSATTADMMAATGVPGARAVYAMAPDFDTYTQLIKPGGIGSDSFIRTWGTMVRTMDTDDFIAMLEHLEDRKYSVLKRWLTKAMIQGLQRPDPEDMPIFERALREHAQSPTVNELVAAMTYKDQPTVEGKTQLTIDDIGLYNYTDAIEASKTFMYTRVGWMDAGVAEGALQKYLTMQRPQLLVIQPSGHVFAEIVDPYTETRPKTADERRATREAFFDYFDKHLNHDAPEGERKIHYFTYGINEWQETESWPPADIQPEIWYFGPNKRLIPIAPKEINRTDSYRVNFTTTTGLSNRWMTQMGRSAAYGDRSSEDKKLLVYTTDPLKENTELTGSVTATLFIESSHSDGAFHVYLEDVGPDGRTTYLSEGMLRGLFRKTADPDSAPYVPLGVYRTFAKKDASPMKPGQVEKLAITLFPISTVFKKGHRIRIALAGYDDALGIRIPKTGTPEWKIHCNPTNDSRVILPLKRLRD